MVAAAAIAVGVCACGGRDAGGDQPAAPLPLAGVFQAGGVSGVRYATPSRTGTTDDAGTFHYLPGETVMFSVGRIQLGSAPGAAAVTPFTLAGTSPPRTERALRLELDRARRSPTAFVRAVNIGRLLISLDADHNPANGLDIAARAATLPDATLDLGLGLREFAARLPGLAPGLTRDIPLRYPLVHLYAAAGVTVPVHAMSERRDYYVEDRPAVTFTDYDATGARKSQRTEFSAGVVGNGTEWSYDPMGRLASAYALVPKLDFFPVDRNVAYEYDALGGLKAVTRSDDFARDGSVDSIDTRRFLRDDFGRVLHENDQLDLGADGSVESSVSMAYTYDIRGNVTLSRRETFANARPEAVTTVSGVYDSLDRPTRTVTETDAMADGIIDDRLVTTYAYDAAASSRVDEVAPTYRRTIVARFDAAGNQVQLTTDYDYLDDGVVETRTEVDLVYDQDRRVLLSTARFLNPDLRRETRTTYRYDELGNLLSQVLERRSAGDPGFRTISTEDYSYGENGELLSIRSSVSIRREFTYIDVPDGVLLLSQEFWEPPAAPEGPLF
jgi:hypothetical protein